MSNQNIWVFFELSDGRPKRVCLEMMQKAKSLAEGCSGKAAAVIIDQEPEEACKAAFENGADQVLIVRQKFFFESAAYILEKLSEKYSPTIIMIGATTEGRDLAASASARLHAGIASECTDVVITGSGVFWIRPSYDGRLNTNIGIEESPMIGTFFLFTGMCELDIGEWQKYAFKYFFLIGILMTGFACLTGLFG